MKPFEVAVFKQFLESRGMVTPFINLFRKYRIKTNPMLIEDYLRQIDASEVCVKAFYWVVNSRWGFDYWTQAQKDFNEYMKRYSEDDEKEPWWHLHGRYKILRTNWDAVKHWKLENRATAATRMNITLPEKLAEKEFFEELEKAEVQMPSDDDETPTPKDDDTPNVDDNGDDLDIFGEFNFVDLTPRRQLKPDEISINRRNKKNSITFNQSVSKEVRERGGYEYAALMRNKSGDVAIILNDTKGVSMLDGRVDKEGGNAVINNKELVSRLVVFLDIKNDYAIVNIEEIKKTNDFVAYRVFINENK